MKIYDLGHPFVESQPVVLQRYDKVWPDGSALEFLGEAAEVELQSCPLRTCRDGDIFDVVLRNACMAGVDEYIIFVVRKG